MAVHLQHLSQKHYPSSAALQAHGHVATDALGAPVRMPARHGGRWQASALTMHRLPHDRYWRLSALLH